MIACIAVLIANVDHILHARSILRRAYSWGHSGNGRLGLNLPNINDHVLIPTHIQSLHTHRIIAAACGAMHTLFLSENGELFSCGNNMFGQLGVGDKDGRNTPVPVIIPAQSTAKVYHSAIAAGQMCSAAILTVGGQQPMLYTWGGNHFGVLGLGEHTEETLLPTAVGSLEQDWLVKAISCGDFHMCAIADFVGTETGDEIVSPSPPMRQRSISSLQNSDTDRVRTARRWIFLHNDAFLGLELMSLSAATHATSHAGP